MFLYIEQNGKYSEGLQLNASASSTSTSRTEDCLQGKTSPVSLANSCNVWDLFLYCCMDLDRSKNKIWTSGHLWSSDCTANDFKSNLIGVICLIIATDDMQFQNKQNTVFVQYLRLDLEQVYCMYFSKS